MLELLYFGCSGDNCSISFVESLTDQGQARTVTENDSSSLNSAQRLSNGNHESMMHVMYLHIMEQETEVAFHPNFY